MKIQLILSILMIVTFISGCSSNPKNEEKKQTQQMSKADVEKMNKEAIERVSKRLEELAIAAKASGPEKVRFLASDMYLKASAALMEGDYQTANLIFKHLMSLAPQDDFIKQKYAISLIRTGDLEDAQGLLKEIFDNSKQRDAKVGLVLAGVYSSLGSTDDARKVYRKILKHHPKNSEACIFLGKSYALAKDSKKAISLLKSCEKKDKGNGIYSYYIGKIFVDKKMYKKAKDYFAKSHRIQKDFSQAIMALGLIHEELGHYKKAKKVYKKYLKKNPSDTLILSRLVQLMFTREDFKEVIEYAERLSDYEPDNLNLKVKLGILYTDVKSYDKAIRSFKDLLAYAPDNDKILYYLGAIYQEMKEYENAIEYFGKIETGSGLYQDSSLQIAQMLSALAKTEFLKDDSKDDYQERFVNFIDKKMQTMAAFKVDFSVIKASYYEGIEDTDEAIDVLEDVKENKSFNNDHKFYLAALYEKDKSFEKSTELVEQIIEADPNNAHAWNFLGYSLVERGQKMDRAYEYINKAIKLSPKDGYIRDSLGWYYFKVGKKQKALDELKQAIKSVPDDSSINKHLAIVYTSLKDFAKARYYIKKALSAVESESEKKELAQVLKDLEKDRVPASFEEIKPE